MLVFLLQRMFSVMQQVVFEDISRVACCAVKCCAHSAWVQLAPTEKPGGGRILHFMYILLTHTHFLVYKFKIFVLCHDSIAGDW